MTEITTSTWTTYVGESHGMRQQLRRAISARYGVPASRIEFDLVG